jgi:hypothetical protein
MALPTTTQPQTITAGPPVVYNPSGDGDKKPIVEVTHQTKMEHGCDTRDDTDDRERDTEILSLSRKPKLVITHIDSPATSLNHVWARVRVHGGKRQVTGENSLQLLLVPHPCQLRLIPGMDSPQLSHLAFLRHRVWA